MAHNMKNYEINTNSLIDSFAFRQRCYHWYAQVPYTGSRTIPGTAEKNFSHGKQKHVSLRQTEKLLQNKPKVRKHYEFNKFEMP